MNILALDVGTSSVRAAVLDTVTAQAVAPVADVAYAVDAPTPHAAEVPAQRLWHAVTTAARTALVASGVSGKADHDVQGVGLACFPGGLALIDATDQPFHPILLPGDRRARSAARQIWGAVGDEFLQTTGNRPFPGLISAVSFRQMLTQDPYTAHKVHGYLHAHSWLGLHMTGNRAFDPGSASCTGLLDTLAGRRWSSRWCDYFEIDPRWLPPLVSGSADLGAVRATIAVELGVPAGIPVKVGVAQTDSVILAADMKPDDLLHEEGATQILTALTDKPMPAPRRLTRLSGVGAFYVQTCHNPLSSAAVDWLHQLCFRDQAHADFLDHTIPQALAHTSRVTLDPPYLAGNELEIEAQRAAFRDLELSCERLDLLAALVRTLVDRQREAAAALGTSMRRIIFSGRGADVVRRIYPEYQRAELVEDGALRGVAKLFLPLAA